MNQKELDFSWNELYPENPIYSQLHERALDYVRILDNSTRKNDTLSWYRKNLPDMLPKIKVLADWNFSIIGKYYWMLNRGARFSTETTNWLNEKVDRVHQRAEEQYIEQQRIDKLRSYNQKYSHDYLEKSSGQEFAMAMEETLLDGRYYKDPTIVWKMLVNSELKTSILKIVIINLQNFVNEYNDYSDEEISEMFQNRKEFETNRDLYIELLTVAEKYQDAFIIRRKNASVKKKAKKKRSGNAALKATYKVNYKKDDATLNLTSIDPILIVGATGLLVYNTKTRKIGLFFAADKTGLQVKGTTIQNFDAEKSQQKILRNPEVQLETFRKITMKRSELILRDNIKATSSKLTGRINADTILMSYWK